MKDLNVIPVEQVAEGSLVVKELDGRVYFETLPLETLVPAESLWGKPPPHQPSAVLGVRG